MVTLSLLLLSSSMVDTRNITPMQPNCLQGPIAKDAAVQETFFLGRLEM